MVVTLHIEIENLNMNCYTLFFLLNLLKLFWCVFLQIGMSILQGKDDIFLDLKQKFWNTYKVRQTFENATKIFLYIFNIKYILIKNILKLGLQVVGTRVQYFDIETLHLF